MITLQIDEQLGWRGGEQQASYLARGLAARGHTVLVACRKKGLFYERHADIPNLTRVPAPFLGEWDLFTPWKLARIIRAQKVDIIHAHTGHAHLHACLARRLAGRGKLVVSRRVDFTPSRNALTRWKYAQPDRIIPVSHYIAQVLIDYGVDPGLLTIIHSTQNPKRFDVSPLPRSELGATEEAPLLICVAALVGHKDHDTLLAAMPAVVREFPKVQLLLVGEGELHHHIEKKIAHLSLEKTVRLLGYRSDVPRILRASDVFVLSSKMEGLGGATLEAMICGLPVVACAAGGIPEAVHHEETGLLVPPGDSAGLAGALIRVLKDPDLARTLVANGHALVEERFTTDRMVDSTLKVYEQLLAL